MSSPEPPFRPVPASADGEQRYIYAGDSGAQIVLAVNVALVTRRPLLVTGVPGSGKSTLARDVARELHWAYLATVITSRTRVDDLVASVDAIRRLSDAQANQPLRPDEDYLVPGVLWWAVDPGGAAERGGGQLRDPRDVPGRSGADRRGAAIVEEAAGRGTVVLLDEIDKAEPDLPNDLLGPLESLRLDIPFVGVRRPAHPVLVLITSNGERELPPAFLRRCIHLRLARQGEQFLASVAQSHFGARSGTLYRAVAGRTIALAAQAELANRRPPSTAEYLDTVRACLELGQEPGSALWTAIEEATLSKLPAASAIADD